MSREISIASVCPECAGGCVVVVLKLAPVSRDSGNCLLVFSKYVVFALPICFWSFKDVLTGDTRLICHFTSLPAAATWLYGRE